MKKVYFLSLFALLLFHVELLQAAAMSSTNFQIVSDAIAVGGNVSTSSNFGVFDTFNVAAAAATSTSSNFAAASDFQYAQPDDNLTVTFSKTAISLGTLSVGSISSDSQIMTVTTNSRSGYTTTIQTDGALRSGSNTIDAASGGSISAGTEAYGVLTTGGNGQLSAITGLSATPQTIARSTVPATAVATTITYQAAIAGATVGGDYSQTVTFTTTANF